MKEEVRLPEEVEPLQALKKLLNLLGRLQYSVYVTECRRQLDSKKSLPLEYNSLVKEMIKEILNHSWDQHTREEITKEIFSPGKMSS